MRGPTYVCYDTAEQHQGPYYSGGHDLQSTARCPLREQDVTDLQHKQETIEENQSIFECLQDRIEELDSEENLDADVTILEDQRTDIASNRRTLDRHFKALDIYLDGTHILFDLERHAKSKDFSHPMVEAGLKVLQA